MLIAVLIAQVGLFYRKELAAAHPALRPVFDTLCANLGCSMALPRDAKLISIEASDLNRPPGRDGVFVLSVTLSNRAEQAQAFPHLELTLTDAQDRAVVRRVFAPAEWLGGEPDADGFAPGATRSAEIEFTAEGVNAAGYRVYAFYP
ncbi:DUF3426 domain-containing protein [Nitrogeniibacter mangrovi]|uniref:DUF3426 domain-containing protein n=1 Tax=Nitrogeniibacter mangrovi TaxID=2016596 RepID=A0A6C1B070_9RHOO|nr:DUF3426 domain-containing protein [Nitrogeniibacter mangrovi]